MQVQLRHILVRAAVEHQTIGVGVEAQVVRDSARQQQHLAGGVGVAGLQVGNVELECRNGGLGRSTRAGHQYNLLGHIVAPGSGVQVEPYLITLTAESARLLDDLADLMSRPESRTYQVVLAGFADNVGTMRNNLKVSGMRADHVGNLLREKGISNVVCEGFGEALPVAPNGRPEGREANRRVEVWIQR